MKNFKLEKGNKATEWSPTLEEQLDIKGENLLLLSNKKVENSNYPLTSYVLTEKIVKGQLYTIQVDAELGEGMTNISIFNSGGTIHLLSLTKDDLKNGVYTKTFIGKDDVRNEFINIYIQPQPTKLTKINWVKLEKGTLATDWTPALEDIENKVENIRIGRNKIINRNLFATTGGDYPAETTISNVINSQGEREVTITSTTASNNKRAYRHGWLKHSSSRNYLNSFPEAKEYVFSFDYKTNHANGEIVLDIREPRLFFNKVLENTNETWKRGHLVCSWKNKTTQTLMLLSVMTNNNAIGNYIAYKNIKLEEGNKPTNDSTAPEDYALKSETISYEEGIWTPSIEGLATKGEATYTNKKGTYRKTGKMVTIQLFISGTFSTKPTGHCIIRGLPFTSENNYSSGPISFSYINNTPNYLIDPESNLIKIGCSGALSIETESATSAMFGTNVNDTKFKVLATLTYFTKQ